VEELYPIDDKTSYVVRWSNGKFGGQMILDTPNQAEHIMKQVQEDGSTIYASIEKCVLLEEWTKEGSDADPVVCRKHHSSFEPAGIKSAYERGRRDAKSDSQT
jgi:hypothetical protein